MPPTLIPSITPNNVAKLECAIYGLREFAADVVELADEHPDNEKLDGLRLYAINTLADVERILKKRPRLTEPLHPTLANP